MGLTQSVITVLRCPACGATGPEHCCVSPRPRERITYVAVDALLSDEVFDRAGYIIGGPSATAACRMVGESVLRAAVDALTGKDSPC